MLGVLLEEVLAWVRSLPGSQRLRAPLLFAAIGATSWLSTAACAPGHAAVRCSSMCANIGVVMTTGRCWIPLRVVGVAVAHWASLALLPRVACAEAGGDTVRMAWVRADGAETCIDQAALKDAVRLRLGRDLFSERAARSLAGDIARRGESFAVALRVRDEQGALLGKRELTVATAECAALSEAIVLAVALAIDPDASLQSPGASDALVRDHEVIDAAPAPPALAAPLTSAPTAAARCPSCSERAAPSSDWAWAVSLRLLGSGGVLPGFAPGTGLWAALAKSKAALTIGVSWFPESQLGGGAFAFGLTTLNIGGCWLSSVRGRAPQISHFRSLGPHVDLAFRHLLAVAAADRRRAHRRREVLTPEQVERPNWGGVGADPERALLQREAALRLEEVLSALALERRAVFVMFEIEGISAVAIGEMLSIPVGTVHSRLFAARAEFEKAVARLERGDQQRGRP